MIRTDLLKEDAINSLVEVPVHLLDGKTVLVTGGAGLIGTHFLYGLARCKELGVNARVVATTRHEFPKYLKEGLPGDFELIPGNLSCVTYVPKADYVIHAATYSQPNLFTKSQVETLKLSTSATMVLLDGMSPDGHFLFISSSEVYSGLESVSPFRETEIGTTTPSHPRACYIEGKRCGEAIINAYRYEGIDSKSARLALAYGPGTKPHDGRVINSFIEQSLGSKIINMRDTGKALRAYCYVSDAVRMLWMILLSGKKEVYNVGGPTRYSIMSIARIIGKETGAVINCPAGDEYSNVGAPNQVRLDISRYTAEFGDMDFMDFEAGLSRTIEWQRGLYE